MHRDFFSSTAFQSVSLRFVKFQMEQRKLVVSHADSICFSLFICFVFLLFNCNNQNFDVVSLHVLCFCLFVCLFDDLCSQNCTLGFGYPLGC